MKTSYLFLFSCSFYLLISCNANRLVLEIPAEDTIAIPQDEDTNYKATIKNKSLQQIDVKVEERNSKAFLSGFGLAPKGKANVPVSKNGQLLLSNDTKRPIKAWVRLKETTSSSSAALTKTTTPTTKQYISFTLVNNSIKAIPLLIPSVMNPNLSPLSRSGVDLKVGQEILFKAKGRKYVLLTVDNTIQNGADINVGDLLKARKKELGL